MISLDMAKKLKDAGLKWEPNRGDWYYSYHDRLYCLGETGYLHGEEWAKVREDIMVFAPRLDQLLAEIEKRGYRAESDGPYPGAEELQYSCVIRKNSNALKIGTGDTRDEAAAQALIWILRGAEA